MAGKGKSPRKHIVLRLRKGWSYDPGRRRFTKPGQDSFLPAGDLPKYTRIKFQIPSLAKKAKRTEAEDELARGIQIVVPGDVRLSKLALRIQNWPCVDKAWVSPEVSPAQAEAKGPKPPSA